MATCSSVRSDFLNRFTRFFEGVAPTYKYVPADVKMDRASYPNVDSILASLRRLGKKVIAFDATTTAQVRRFGDLLQAHPEIESLDSNPAVIYEDRYVVVDAKGVVAK